MAGDEAAIVTGIVPRQHFIRHRFIIQGLVVLQGGVHLRAAHNHSFAVSLHDLAAVAPEDRPEGGIGVIAVTDGDTYRMALFFQHTAGFQHIIPTIGRLQPRFVKLVLVIQAREGPEQPTESKPVPIDKVIVVGEVVPTAVLPVQGPRHVVEGHEKFLIEVGLATLDEGDIMAGLRLHLCSELRRDL
jgi:hypothetical protein